VVAKERISYSASPSFHVSITRQKGSSGDWAFEDYLRRGCAAVAKTD
jgi:hypothetical protein